MAAGVRVTARFSIRDTATVRVRVKATATATVVVTMGKVQVRMVAS